MMIGVIVVIWGSKELVKLDKNETHDLCRFFSWIWRRLVEVYASRYRIGVEGMGWPLYYLA